MKFFMQHGLLGVLCYIAWWLSLIFLTLYFLVKIWPVVLVVLVLVVAIVVWRKRRKRIHR